MCYFFKDESPKVDPSKASKATVAVVPLPKDTLGIIFGQRTSEYCQRCNTYIVGNDGIVLNPQVVWNAPSQDDGNRFEMSKIVPEDFPKAPDHNILSVDPVNEDRHIGIYSAYKRSEDSKYEESVSQYTTYEFKIGGKNAISFTMINTGDGSGSGRGFHDTVVGVAVVYTTK